MEHSESKLPCGKMLVREEREVTPRAEGEAEKATQKGTSTEMFTKQMIVREKNVRITAYIGAFIMSVELLGNFRESIPTSHTFVLTEHIAR